MTGRSKSLFALALAALALALATAPAAGAAGARFAIVPDTILPYEFAGGEGALQADDRYVIIATASRLTTVWDSQERRIVKVSKTCGPEEGSPIADVEAHRLLVAARSAGCGPAVVDLERDGAVQSVDMSGAFTPHGCYDQGDDSCPVGSVVEFHRWLAADWVIGTFEVVGQPAPGLVARNLATGERRELFRAGDQDVLQVVDVTGNRVVFSVLREIRAGRPLSPVERYAIDLDTGTSRQLATRPLLFAFDAERILTAASSKPRSLLLQAVVGDTAAITRIRLPNRSNLSSPEANAGAVTWGNDYGKPPPRRRGRRTAQRGNTRRFDIHVYDTATRRASRLRHAYRSRSYQPRVTTIATAHAIVWAVARAPIVGVQPKTDFYFAARPGTESTDAGR